MPRPREIITKHATDSTSSFHYYVDDEEELESIAFLVTMGPGWREAAPSDLGFEFRIEEGTKKFPFFIGVCDNACTDAWITLGGEAIFQWFLSGDGKKILTGQKWIKFFGCIQWKRGKDILLNFQYFAIIFVQKYSKV